MSWSRPFEDPIPLPRGRKLVTQGDAGDYVAKLPKAEYMTVEWQAAMFALMLVVDLNGPDHDGAHWRHESIEPRASPGV